MQHVFLPSLLVVAGVSLFAGFNHLIAWSRRAPDALTHGWFGLIALLAGAYTIAAWDAYRATDLDDLVRARRAAIGLALVVLPAFVFFTIRYARWRPRPAAHLVWVVPLAMAVANLFLPYTIAYSREPELRLTVLGDGTIVSTIAATPTYAAVMVWVPVYLFVLVGAWRLWHAGDRERAIPIAIGTLLMVAAGVNDMLVARGAAQVYLSEFAFLGLVGLMSVRLSEELVGAAALQRALGRSEQRLRLTLDSIADAVILVDADGRVSLMNPAATRLMHLSGAEAAGNRLEDVLRVPAGLEIVASSAAVLDERGTPGGAVVVMRDVTRERELERRIRETRTMRAVGESAGSIAHEYNNLLAIVLGHAELLAQSLPEEDAEARDSMHAIEDAVRRALELSRRTLALSPARDTPLTIVPMHAVVESVLRLLGDILGPRIEIRTALRAPIDAVAGDPDELRSALVNLAMNARDAMPSGGELRIESDVARVTGDEIVAQAFELVPGAFFRLHVSDTGTGIPAAVRDRIFEPFFTTKPRGQGMGLGLAAVYSAVTEPGGAVEVQSEPGAGTVFTLWLPVIEPAEA
ncbi:MAG TPA: ATP-binding protein [Longimicrobiales bacterium]|nr:ATP-binding protein [Longimicrobiales bacterium]